MIRAAKTEKSYSDDNKTELWFILNYTLASEGGIELVNLKDSNISINLKKKIQEIREGVILEEKRFE